MKKQININIDAKWLAETDKLIKISKRDLDEITNITADQERVVGINISARRYSKVLGDILSETIKKYEDFAKEIKEIISSESQNIQAGEIENLPQTQYCSVICICLIAIYLYFNKNTSISGGHSAVYISNNKW